MSSVLSVADLQAPNSIADEPSVVETLDDVELTIELGHTRLSLSDVQQLRPGVMVSLDEYLNDPVTLFVGTKLVGRGEVLLIDGKLGVGITELYRS